MFLCLTRLYLNINVFFQRNPPAKKSKAASKSSGDGDEEHSWSLGKNRFVKLREFKGKYYVDIREFYNADGDLKPGKKGISLSLEQWHKLTDLVSDVDDAIKSTV